MKLEIFKEILNKIRSQEKKINAAYKINIDLIDFMDDYASAIHMLFSTYYGSIGAGWISWYLYERDILKDAGSNATDKDGNPICYDDESLWKEVEKDKISNLELDEPSNEEDYDYLKSIFEI